MKRLHHISNMQTALKFLENRRVNFLSVVFYEFKSNYALE